MRILVVLLLVAFVAAEQKREANPEPGFRYGPYGFGHGLGFGRGLGYGTGVAYHPYGGRSYVHSNLHSIHKREAEAEAEPGFLPTYGYSPLSYGYGYNVAPIGYGYGHLNPYASSASVHSYHHTIGKRAADPGFLGGYGYPSLGAAYGYSTAVQHPGYGVSYQHRQGVVLPSYGLY
ncbi:hypothetical protein SK128_021753 [Halocaridina rubra]|uniref:Uncharacterized protein n=2 Tax=Halocaridina rubra TaxID=373956 RepID=A0AAN8X3P4_HALRR